MANISQCCITLYGKQNNMLKAYQKIKKAVKDNELRPWDVLTKDEKSEIYKRFPNEERYIVENFYKDSEIISFEFYDNQSIDIELAANWCVPSQYIKDIVQECDLDGLYTDYDPCSNSFYKIIFENGKVKEEINV